MIEPLALILTDDGTFPNNSALPALLYRGALEPVAENIERVFHGNNWTGSWRNGVYDFHHYHSAAHEVLGVFAGAAVIGLGGESGETVRVKAGDVVVIPAGVAHKRLSSSDGFAVVGAYPDGQRPDMCYGQPGERPDSDRNIATTLSPSTDPIYGNERGLMVHWGG